MLDLIHEYLYTIESTGAGLVFLGNPWVWVPHVSLCKVPRHTLQCVSTDRTKPKPSPSYQRVAEPTSKDRLLPMERWPVHMAPALSRYSRAHLSHSSAEQRETVSPRPNRRQSHGRRDICR